MAQVSPKKCKGENALSRHALIEAQNFDLAGNSGAIEPSAVVDLTGSITGHILATESHLCGGACGRVVRLRVQLFWGDTSCRRRSRYGGG